MIYFDLIGSQAENDVLKSNSKYGVLVVKNDIPQLFIAMSKNDLDDWSSIIRIDPNHVEEITKTTRVYFGYVDDDLVFIVDKKLF